MEYKMNLHKDIKLFNQAIRATAQQMNILDIYVEKDYWVTLALHAIFHDDIASEAVFKGGTALSKCYRVIERFSEDIDLVVLQEEGDSGNKLSKKLKSITNAVGQVITEVEDEGITNKKGMIRKVAYDYPKIFKGVFGQVRNKVIVEATWLGRFEPYKQKYISSYIYEMMKKAGQLDLAEQFNLLPFQVNVLESKRTICEKIMSLVRFSYSEKPIEDLRNKIRHCYDIHQLLKQESIIKFFNSPEFDQMLLLVGQDDVTSFKTGNEWLFRHPKEAVIFSKTNDTWMELKSTYSNEFKQLVYGELPNENDVFNSLMLVSDRLNRIAWSIHRTR